jgi:hypothetical protein
MQYTHTFTAAWPAGNSMRYLEHACWQPRPNIQPQITATWSAIYWLLAELFPISHDVLKWRLCGREITHSKGLQCTCKIFMLSKVILYFWYFKSSWNHTVCLHLIFMAVLRVPINHKHRDYSTASQKVGRHWSLPSGNTRKIKRMRQLQIIGA